MHKNFYDKHLIKLFIYLADTNKIKYHIIISKNSLIKVIRHIRKI
jgi:hypothetical protein